MQHSNRACVLGLAPGHHIFHTCRDDKGTKQDHTILGVDFQLTDSFNLLNSKVSGRRKRGSHRLQHGVNQCIGYVVCSRGIHHPLLTGGGISGRIYECNSRLLAPEQTPAHDQVSLAPIGHVGNNSAYLAIFMPFRAGSNDSRHGPSSESKSFLSKDGMLTGGLNWEEYKALRNL